MERRFTKATEIGQELWRNARKFQRAHDEAMGRIVLGGRTLKEGLFAEALADGATLFVGKGVWKALTEGQTVEGDHVIVEGVSVRLCGYLADDAVMAMKMPDF